MHDSCIAIFKRLHPGLPLHRVAEQLRLLWEIHPSDLGRCLGNVMGTTIRSMPNQEPSATHDFLHGMAKLPTEMLNAIGRMLPDTPWSRFCMIYALSSPISRTLTGTHGLGYKRALLLDVNTDILRYPLREDWLGQRYVTGFRDVLVPEQDKATTLETSIWLQYDCLGLVDIFTTKPTLKKRSPGKFWFRELTVMQDVQEVVLHFKVVLSSFE